MAVKQHVSEVDERSDVQPVELEQIIQTIELIRQSRSDLLIGSNLVTLFETIVHCLGEFPFNIILEFYFIYSFYY